MKKNTLIIGLVILVIVGVGLVWLLVSKASAPSSPSTSTNNTSNSSSTNTSQNNDQVQSGTVNVAIQNEAFSPQSITIKKGTKVVWTNNDSIQHDVVATDGSNPDNLPTANDLFGKGGTYSFTFNTAGTIDYHCAVHPFMTGTVKVVD